jgi:hypothetical protein
MILESHLLSMIIYAFLVSVVMALIRRTEKKERVRYGVTLFLVMVAGAVAFGWFMYLFIKR